MQDQIKQFKNILPDIRKIYPKFSQKHCHFPLLLIQSMISVGQGENSKFAALELFSGCQNVGQEKGQASVIVATKHQ